MHRNHVAHSVLSALVVLSLTSQPVLARPGLPAASPAPNRAAGSVAAAPAAPAAQTVPLAAAPLAVVKSQSTFSAGGLVAVTYAVRNVMGPEARPEIAPGADVTATMDAILATNFAADSNSIRGAALALELTEPQSAFHSASLPVEQDGATLAVNLGDVPPLGERRVTITVTTPAAAADFVELDTGAVVSGNWRGRPVSDQAGAIRLAPDGLSQWLACTPDANCADPVVLRQAAALGNDPNALFGFVRELDYESYVGSLRGARGALWSAAGNGYDQASLLIALLRASGIPAAYRQGTLSAGAAQTLVEAMFPAVASASGLVGPGTSTADPGNDPALLAEAQDHAWVEAYLPGSGWTALDPSFSSANAGQVFGTPTSGQLPELPDSVRHKVTLALVVEKYSAFPVSGGNLYRTYPLTATLNTVELVGEPVVFAHLVESSTPPGMVFATAEHTYTPYFVVGVAETLIEGSPFSELISNFPLAQDFVVGEWLNITTSGPDGSSDTYQRELFDDIGYAVRTQGGLVGELARDATARVSPMSSWNTLFSPSAVPLEAVNDTYQDMVRLALDGIAAREAIEGVPDTENPTPDQVALAQATAITYGLLARLAQRQHLLEYAAAADQAHAALADTLLVRGYPDSPRVFTVGWERNDTTQTETISFDLGRNPLRALAFPGQTDTGRQAFNFWRGLLDMSLEHELLVGIAPEPVVSVAAVLNQAIAAGIEFERITPGTLDVLADLPISDQAKARISTALAGNPNLYVLVPSAMVMVPGAAEATIGWLQIDQNTLEVVDVMEDGQHVAAITYAALGVWSKKIASFLGGFSAGFLGYVMGFWAGFFGLMPLNGWYIGAVIAAAKESAEAMGEQAELACYARADRSWCKKGVGAGTALGAAIIGDDPPLQEALFDLPAAAGPDNPQASASVTEAATLSGSTIDADLTMPLMGVYGTANYAWDLGTPSSFAFSHLTLSAAQVYSNGVLLASGTVTATPAAGDLAVALATGAVTVDGSASGSLSLHAPGLATLHAGSQWEHFDFGLSAAASYTLALSGASVDVNGTAYSGNLDLVATVPASVTGAGATAAPNFADSLTVNSTGTGFTAAPASGTLTVGGSPAPTANGFALGGANGTAEITPAGAASDAYTFSGTADFFAVSLDSDSSTIPASSAASFDADVAANFADTYTMTVFGPQGWTVTVNGAGQVTAAPPLGAAPGEYGLIVTAQSATYPDLFASAEHTVSLTGVDGVQLSVAPDPLFTVPWGPASDVINFDLAVGRVQLEGAAFSATITNTSTSARTFDVAVAGLPAGWAVFGGQPGSESVALLLAAGEVVRLGLYLSPTVASLPAPGTNYPFDLTATAQDNAGVSATDSDVFTMPAVAYPALSVEPDEIFTAANSQAAFELTVTNAGNAPGSFNLAGRVPDPTWQINSLQSPTANLAPGASAVQTITVSVTTGAAGVDYPVAIGAGAPGLPYTPTTAVDIYVIGPLSSPAFLASGRVGEACPAAWSDLAAALETLALAMSALEGSCTEGNCSLTLRDEVVNTLEGAAYYAEAASPLITTAGALNTWAATMAGHTSDVDLEADLAGVSAAVDDLGDEVCEVCQHQPAVRWTPSYDAGLPGQPVTYTLTVENQGTLTTTYAVTVTTPAGLSSFTPTLAPGASDISEWAASAVGLGLHELTVEATATGAEVTLPNLTAAALARLNVVDRFVQVTTVSADPPFVETGVSSTTLSVEVANIANVARAATAHTAILEPGGAVSHTADVPLALLVGAPRTYALGSVNTSGWAAGVYTVTVDLLDAADNVIPDGSGYGYFAVGQGLVAAHAVSPTTAAPGTFTVTTIITTEIPAGLPFVPAESAASETTEEAAVERGAREPSGTAVLRSVRPRFSPVQEPAAQPLLDTPGLTRTEQSGAAFSYTGAWTGINSSLASGGSYTRSAALSATASITFDGGWANLGLLGGPNSGKAEVYLDGASQGVVDLYRREDTALSFVYTGFVTGTHTLSVTVLATRSVNSTGNNVQLDYLDVWDGTALPEGVFEQNNERVYLSTGWGNVNDVDASGGSYVDSGAATAWFIFTGESVTYQALAQSNNGRVQVYLDGQFQATQDLYAVADITRTLSFTGLAPGPHIMQVSTYYGEGTLDALITPGQAPYHTPPVAAGFTRYEDDDPGLLYNGLPFTLTRQTWARSNANALVSGWTSAGQYIASGTPGDTVSLTFSGEWVSVGFSGEPDSGQAEIFIDGASQGIVDLYRNEDDAISFTYAGLTTGTHTISITVLGTANPLAGGDAVPLDFIDVWDGTELADGAFEQSDSRVLRSSNWGSVNSASASGGAYLYNSFNATAWFAFTDDSVTYQAFDVGDSDQVMLRIDGGFAGYADIHTNTSPTHTFSFEGLGPGVHVLQVRQYRNAVTLDAVYAPAITAPTPVTPTPFTRLEEDDPAILYNGLPYTLTARQWDRVDNVTYASDGQYFGADVDGDWVSFDFTGTWVRAGLITADFGGQVEVFIDGASQGVVELYTRDPGVTAAAYGGLADTNHTISVTLLSTQHANATSNWLLVDYFDTWDGTALPLGTYEEDDALVWRSSTHENWTTVADAGASGGSYLLRSALQPDGTLWFPFTGDSVGYQAMAHSGGGRVTLSLDGVSQGTFNLYNATSLTRTFAFDGLGAGPHVLELRYYRQPPTLDAFQVPGAAPYFVTPVYTGVVRYEEDHPAVRYDGYDWAHRPTSWGRQAFSRMSGQQHASTTALSDTVSLTFDGRWVLAGFRGTGGTSQARVYIDGIDQGLVNLTGADQPIGFTYGNLVTGTHTISVTRAAGTMYFDYFDVWDGQAMPDDFQNARLAEDNGRLHYGGGMVDDASPNALQDDYVRVGLLNSLASIWYSFVGDSFTLLPLSRPGGGTMNVYVDGVLTGTVDITYPFSEQPLAFHYSGLDDGPHTVTIANILNMQVDAFGSNPDSLAAYAPRAEWWDNTLGGGVTWGGIVTPIAVGDLNADGSVELVVSTADPTNNGTLAVFRGDGQDTGDGDPILWSVPYNIGPIPFEHMAAPAIGDLDGLPGAEIVVPNVDGLYAYHADGTSYWFTDTLASHVFYGAPAIGNLDLEPLPEVVVNLDDTLAVFEHDGTLAWSHVDIDGYFNPVLADLTGDGLLDILANDGDDTLYLWDYNLGTPTVAFSVTFASAPAVYGGPAVADIDGLQPGGDAGPEIAVATSGTLQVLDADGSPVWSAPLDPGQPGGVSIADLDGDGEVEILTSTDYNGGRLVAYNADGTVLWNVAALDNSPANASLMDLDGDGAYEVTWVGPPGQGLHLFDGADGSTLFQETGINSLTGLDFAVFADVDLDGYGELVVPSGPGPRVVGWDGVWTVARPLWNQHSYHITNANDDLSIPAYELNSWDAHNTFRTQYPAAAVLPVYDVSLAHTAGISGVTVLTGTFNVAPDLSADPVYGWDYAQTWAEAVVTRAFDSRLANLRPGEARLVAAGTEVSYTLPSGTNHLTLPPLYVNVPHILSLEPATRTVGAGGVVTYAVRLTNPAAAPDTYALTISGVPETWASLPGTVPLAASGDVTVTLTVTIPAGTAPGAVPVVVSAVNGAGGSDQSQVTITVVEALSVEVSPATQSAATGQSASYALTVTNHETAARTYSLSAVGLADLTLPPTVTVPAGDSVELEILAVAGSEGPHPFAVLASYSGGSASDSALLETSGRRAVALDLAPSANAAGPGSTAVYTLTVTNGGTVADSFDLSLDLPSGWSAELTANGANVNTVSLPPDLFNSAEVRLLVTPSVEAAPGLYQIGVTAQSQLAAAVTATVTATLEVLTRGVQVALSPTNQTLDPMSTGQWQVTITNTGSVADIYDLTLTGLLGLVGQISANPVGLGPGATTSIPVTADDFDFVLPASYPVGVAAVSQADDRVQDEATATVSFSAFEAVQVGWTPVSQTVAGQTGALVLAVTNTANVGTTFALSLDMPGLSGALSTTELALPAHSSALLPLFVEAAAPGTYSIEASAESNTSPATGGAAASVTFNFEAPAAPRRQYLSYVHNGQAVSPALPPRVYLPAAQR